MARGLNTATNVFILFIISRFMGPQELGVYGIAFTIFNLFFSVASMNLWIYIGREMAHLKEDRQEVFNLFGETMAAAKIGGLAAAIVLLGVVAVYRELGIGLVLLTFAAGVLWGVEKNLSGFLLGRERMDLEALTSGLTFALTVTLLVLSKNNLTIHWIFVVRIIGLLVGIGARFYFIRDCVVLSGLKARMRKFQDIKYFWFTNVASFVFRQVDVLVLSFFVGKALLGSYFLALRIFMTVNIVSEVLAMSLTPFISRSFKGKERVSFRRMIMMALGTSFLLGLVLGGGVFWGRDLLISIFNRELVAGAGGYLKLLAWMIPFRMGMSMLGAFLSSSQYQNYRFYLSLLISIPFTIATAILSFLHAADGAIIARLGTEIMAFGLYFYTIFFKLKLRRD
jgi:O-antigen/teichoic acid export membrane protein